MTPSNASEATPLIQYLASQANNILGTIVQKPLVALNTGSSGMFPYNYQNSSNLLFNHLTYNWIKTNLRANTTPEQLDSGVFANFYISVLSSVVWGLSKADLAALNAAQAQATVQQAALLNAWQAAYGSIPPATKTQQPIDIITSTIATSWATPSTTLTAMKNSINLTRLLNNTPASGQPILPVLAAWLNAIGVSIGIQNNVTMNNAYVQNALAAVQSPVAGNPSTGGNGGLLVDDNTTVPGFTITPQMSDIQNALADTGTNSITLTMTVSRSSQSELTVSVQGGSSFTIPILDLFGITASGSASYFSDQIAISSNTVSINMKFSGVNFVSFGPLSYDMSSGLGWAYFSAIQQAITNGTTDVSGFKFSPTPQIDFSPNGPFGYVNGLAICNYPSIEITVTGSNAQSILTTFTTQSSTSVSFLGIPLASASESTYNSSAKQSSTANSVVITLSPPQGMIAGVTNDSVGWILGADVNYPCE